MQHYKPFTFQEFHSIVNNYLNEDVWLKIFKLAIPKFKTGDQCVKPFPRGPLTIVQVFYSQTHNYYTYSYKTNRYIAKYALEKHIKPYEKE